MPEKEDFNAREKLISDLILLYEKKTGVTMTHAQALAILQVTIATMAKNPENKIYVDPRYPQAQEMVDNVCAEAEISFGQPDSVKEKNRKFKELEEKFVDREQIVFEKALWLTNRGNYSGNIAKFTEAVVDFKEALELKGDFLPAYFGLYYVYRDQGLKDKARASLDSAPEELRLHGKVCATKQAMLEAEQLNLGE